MTITLVTGAGKGLGREAAARLLAAGHDVWIGARNPTLGAAAAADLGARFVEPRVAVAETTADDLRSVFETNVFGVVRVTQAFLPLLRRSAAPVIVNVSSGLGSFGRTTDPARVESQVGLLAYPASKSALTMLTSQYAKALPAMRVNAVDPGYTATDLNAHRGTQTVEEGTDAIVRLATVGPDGPTGGFFDREGVVPW